MGFLTRKVPATLSQNLTRLALGAFMTGAGLTHLTVARDEAAMLRVLVKRGGDGTDTATFNLVL